MFKKIIKCFIRRVENKKILSVFLILGYVVGIIVGVVLAKNQSNYKDFYDFVANYHNRILGLYSSPIKLTFTRLINDVFYFLLLYLLCFNIALSGITVVIFVYRGIVLGSVFFVFFDMFSLHGIIIYVFLVVIQNALVTFGLFYTAICVYDLRGHCNKKYFSKFYLSFFIIGYIIAVIGAVYEFILLITFFRPLNIYF